jgi:hypothetical protein
MYVIDLFHLFCKVRQDCFSCQIYFMLKGNIHLPFYIDANTRTLFVKYPAGFKTNPGGSIFCQ